MRFLTARHALLPQQVGDQATRHAAGDHGVGNTHEAKDPGSRRSSLHTRTLTSPPPVA